MASSTPAVIAPKKPSIALVGHPNVGKSVIFQRLSGQRVIVANYPGTTVELTRGYSTHDRETPIVDTPGVITLPANTEDERVTERVLVHEPLHSILQVGDAKNLRRTLLLTAQLAELGRPMLLALNMMDEAGDRDIQINQGKLAELLAIPIVPTTATQGKGIRELTHALDRPQTPDFHIQYPPAIEAEIEKLAPLLPVCAIAPRAAAVLWLKEDPVIEDFLEGTLEPEVLKSMRIQREDLQAVTNNSVPDQIHAARHTFVEGVVHAVQSNGHGEQKVVNSFLTEVSVHPVFGWFLLAGVLYLIYWFVGVFGAGILVDALEAKVFGQWINPWISTRVIEAISIPWIVDLLVGEYGLWTIGITYALALILPIVTTFFLAFGVMEDTGYLPRLAALTNELFRKMGLNGKAVLPMILGLGCVTMATMTTRVLENKRERVLVTLLLALAIPCSAQLGVVMGLLAGISLTATLIWAGVVAGVLLVVGWLAEKFIPGERSSLLIELPPLRRPILRNVTIKTLARVEWYLKEVVPLFLIGAAVIFTLDLLGALDWLSVVMRPLVVNWLGLPSEASTAFLMGFLRRDFGATGLFVMEAQGLLSPAQVVVSMTAITLFIPCLASVLMIAKEHGNRQAIAMTILIFPLAFFIAGVLARTLSLIGWGL